MPQDTGWGTMVWSVIDHGFRFLFFESFYGWIIVSLAIVAVLLRLMHERRQLP